MSRQNHIDPKNQIRKTNLFPKSDTRNPKPQNLRALCASVVKNQFRQTNLFPKSNTTNSERQNLCALRANVVNNEFGQTNLFPKSTTLNSRDHRPPSSRIHLNSLPKVYPSNGNRAENRRMIFTESHMKLSGLFLAILTTALALGQSYTVSTVAGTDTLRDGGPATSSLLRRPFGVAVDSAGNTYVADMSDHRVRKITPAGIISTFAGNGQQGFSGENTAAIEAQLDSPQGLAVDAEFLYIADYGNERVRKVSLKTGMITTIGGNGSFTASGDGGQATSAGMDPYNLAVDNKGNVFIADYYNSRIRRIATNGIITTVAGTGAEGYSGDNGQANLATLFLPSGVAVDSDGVLYISDLGNSVIRKVSSSGIITTIAGTGLAFDFGDNGPATAAYLVYPDAVALNAAGSQLYISTFDRIRVINLSSGIISAYAGFGDIGFRGDGGHPSQAVFYLPLGLTVAPNGDVLIGDTGNYRLRKVSGGVINTMAGTDVKDGSAARSAYLNRPEAVAVSSNGDFYISDTLNSRIRKVAALDERITTIAGNGNTGTLQGRIGYPSGLAVERDGNLLLADFYNNRILRASLQGQITIVAGSTRAGFGGDGGLAGAATLNTPGGVAVDSAGNIYIADTGNNRVRKIAADTGIITTVAGTGRAGASGIGGAATAAQLNADRVALDAAGNLYIADRGNHRVLKVTTATGIISIFAGTGVAGFRGDGGFATAAQLTAPSDINFDAAGNAYIADFGNGAVRRVTPQGVITTIAGNGRLNFDVESGPALAVAMGPVGVSQGPNGSIFIVDWINDRVRKLTPVTPSNMAISAGNNQTGAPGDKFTVSVRVRDVGGSPVGGVAITFAVTTGTATLSPTQASTGGDGIASTQVTLGDRAGAVVVTATASGLPAVTFNLTINAVITNPPPQITAGGIVGAGLSLPAKRTLSTNGIGSIFGNNFAPAGTARKVEVSDLVNGRVPTILIGVCVEVAGVRAPVFAVYPGQVNFQVPAVASGEATVRVITECGTATAIQSNGELVTISANAPEFFFFKANGDGNNPIAAIDALTGAYLASPTDLAGARATKPNDVVTAFGTNFGSVSPAVVPGDFPPGIAAVTAEAKLSIGGKQIPAANLLYVGVTPQSPGLFQVNFIVPADVADGDLEVILTIGGKPSPPGAYLTIRR